MKKLIILVLLIFTSCDKDDLNCDCDRVTLVNNYNNGHNEDWGRFWVKNDCTGIELERTFMFDIPVVGQCITEPCCSKRVSAVSQVLPGRGRYNILNECDGGETTHAWFGNRPSYGRCLD